MWINPQAYATWSRIVDIGSAPISSGGSTNGIWLALTAGGGGNPVLGIMKTNTDSWNGLRSAKQLALNTWTHLSVTLATYTIKLDKQSFNFILI